MRLVVLSVIFLFFFPSYGFSQYEMKWSPDFYTLYKRIGGNTNLKDTTLDKPYEFDFGQIKNKLPSNEKYIISIADIKNYSINELVENLYRPFHFKFNGLSMNDVFMTVNLYTYMYSDDYQVYYKPLLEKPYKVQVKENMMLETYFANLLTEHLDSLNIIRINFTKASEREGLCSIIFGMYGSGYQQGKETELVYLYGEKEKWTREIHENVSNQFKRKDYLEFKEQCYYQLIDNKGKQVLKIDTTRAAVKSFLQYYRKNPNVEVFHLKDFVTKDRFIDFPKDWGQGEQRGDVTEVMKINEGEFIKLYEYCPAVDTGTRVKIGKLLSDNIITLYEKSWFLKNVENGLIVSLPEGEFVPIYLELILFDTKGYRNFIRTDSINNHSLKTIWDGTPDIAGVYIQNVIFLDKSNRRTRIPNTFIYYFSK